MEELLDSGDIGETIDEIVNEWNGEDLDELYDSIESYFAESNIEIQFLQDDDFEDEEEDDSEYDYEDLADMETLRSDVEMDVFLLDGIEELTLKTYESNSLETILGLKKELEEMTRDLDNN